MLPINVSQFLISMRDAGYSLTESVSEVIDNAIEAGSSFCAVKTISNNKQVDALVMADDGIGMTKDGLHKYLVLGESSRYFSDKTIGKYGVGAKAAAYSSCKRIDVYSRLEGTLTFYHTFYDLDLLSQDPVSNIEIIEPQATKLPSQISDLFADNSKLNTVVVWSKFDRWPQKSFNFVINDLKSELGRIFRKFIYSGFEISVNGDHVSHFDPTGQLDGGYVDTVLTKAYDGEDAPIRHFEPLFIKKNHVLGEVCNDDGSIETATLTVTLLNPHITRKAGMGGDALARALKLKFGEGKISYLRNHREVGYSSFHNAFGRQVRSEDRFLGLEINFSSCFDSEFGTRMVKRGIEPKGKIKERIQQALKEYTKIGIDHLMQRWRSKDSDVEVDFDAVEKAVERLSTLFTAQPNNALNAEDQAKKYTELLKLASQIGLDEDDSRRYADRKASRPYVMESVDSLIDGQLLDFVLSDSHVVIRINRSHSIYKSVWQPLSIISKLSTAELEHVNPAQTAAHALQSLNLMIISFAKQQANRNHSKEYIDDWSQSLQHLLKHVELNQ